MVGSILGTGGRYLADLREKYAGEVTIVLVKDEPGDERVVFEGLEERCNDALRDVQSVVARRKNINAYFEAKWRGY